MLNRNYNSNREALVLPEYGRHISKIISKLCEIEDREQRNAGARRVIEIMGNINPSLRDSPIFKHKLWDHLFVISDFKLDIDSPHEKPTREELKFRPRKIAYPKRRFSHKQYGNNIREILNKLRQIEGRDEEVRTIAIDIARFMKYKSFEFNQEHPCNDVIVNDIKAFTRGEIVLEQSVLDDTKLPYNKPKSQQQRQSYGSQGYSKRPTSSTQRPVKSGFQKKTSPARTNNNRPTGAKTVK